MFSWESVQSETGNYAGLLFSVATPDMRPPLCLEATKPFLLRLVIGKDPLVWIRIGDEWDFAYFLYPQPSGHLNILAPLRARDHDHALGVPYDNEWWNYWCKTYFRELVDSPCSPIHQGTWRVAPRIFGGEPTPWPYPRTLADYRYEDQDEPPAPDRRIFDLIGREWRKRAVRGTLPPLVAVWHVRRWTEPSHHAAAQQQASQGLAAVLSSHPTPAVIRGANATLLRMYGGATRLIPKSRAWPLPGGKKIWLAQVTEQLKAPDCPGSPEDRDDMLS